MRLIVALALVFAGASFAVETTPAQEAGTTIFGESEAAVGLYLMPWSEEPAGDVDRPPRLLDEPLEAIDPERFRRQVEWYQAQTAYRMLRLQRGY